MLDRLLDAVRLGDRSTFDTELTSPDSAFGNRLFANLSTLPAGAVQFVVQSQTSVLSADRLAALPGGWAQQVTVSSRLDHDTGPSTYEIWFAVAPGPRGVRLDGLAEQSSSSGPPSRPLWLTQPIQAVTGPDATVLAGGDQTDLTRWLRRAETAEKAVRARTRKQPGRRWGAGLVIELPSTEAAFDQALGVQAGSYDQIAAVAWPQGPDPATAAVRVVVNPSLADRLDDARLEVLITHEATHVITRSVTSPAPIWLVEGFADWVAFDRVPSAAPASVDLVLADVRQHGAPTGFPADADFAPDAADLDLTYGRAWMLCRYVAETWSARRLVRLYAEVDRGTALPDAFSDVLGVDESILLARWQAWLERQADR